MMKYKFRVVKMSDGYFKAQIKFGFFFWYDSAIDKYKDKQQMIEHTKRHEANMNYNPPKPKILKVVWP